jgi:hypothetical protein
MHRDKPSLKEGMQDWLDTPWVDKCYVYIIVNIPHFIKEKMMQ